MSSAVLPGWASARVEDIATLVNGFAFTPRHWKRAGLPIVRIQNLNDSEAPFNYCPDELPDKFRITTGELLFAWSGTPGTSFGAHVWQGGDAYLNQHIFKVVFDRALLDVRYFQLALNHNLGAYVAAAQGGSGLAHITKKAFGASRVLVAPRGEQLRIVAEVDRLLADIDEGVAALQRTETQLERYRSDIMTSALGGDLTSEWRSRQRALTPATALLERARKGQRQAGGVHRVTKAISARSRRAHSREAGLSQVVEGGALGPSVLPDGWCWTTLETIAEVVSGIAKDQKKARLPGTRKIPYLRVANVQRGFLDLVDVKTISASDDTIRNLRLEVGDVLFTEGGDRDKLGRGWIWEGQLPECIHQNHVFRARLYVKDILPVLISHHGNTFGREWFRRAGKQTTNLASISVSVLRRFPVPLAPATEQRQIVKVLDGHLSRIDAGEVAVREGAQRAERLRRQVLLDAFAGKLVSQNPTGTPAALLVEGLRRYQQELRSQPRTETRSSARLTPGSMDNTMSMGTRRSLLVVLKEHPKGLTPEELLRESGYGLDDIEEFYEALRAIARQVDERRAQSKAIRDWPHVPSIRLHLKRD